MDRAAIANAKRITPELFIYADVDPDAKLGAVGKIEESFESAQNDLCATTAHFNGFDPTSLYNEDEVPGLSQRAASNRVGFAAGMGNFTLSAQSLPFTEEELEEMLAKVRTAKQKAALSE